MINKIKAVMSMTGTTQLKLAKALSTTQANISRIVNLGDKIRICELKELVSVCGGTVEVSIVLPNGTKL